MSHAVTIWLRGLAGKKLTKASINHASLAKLLKRADSYPIKAGGFEARASHLFHQSTAIPHAVCSAQVELAEANTDVFWLRVDPVQLIPDRDTLVLIPPSELALTELESKSLLEAFNLHFKQDGVELVYGSASSWYLSVLQVVDIQTTPLRDAAFHNLQGLFPQGHAASHWRKLMNEAQMLFYNHPVNLARRERGAPEINSIWLWGEGLLDTHQLVPRSQAKIWGQGAYLEGMAHLTQAHFSPLPKDYQAWFSEAEESQTINQHLIVLDVSQQADADEVLALLESNWCEGLLAGLSTHQLHSVYIDLDLKDGFLLEPGYLKRFWRWRHPLASYCS